jgi:Tetratricopeptide repeat
MHIGRHVGSAARFAACLCLFVATSRHATAQEADAGPTKADRVAARDAYDKGTKSFQKGDYAKALDSFVKANALIPSVQAMYWIAQAQDKLGNAEAAKEAYEAVVARADFSKLSADKATVVRERLAALQPPPPPAPPPSEPEPSPAPVEVEPAPPPPPASPAPPAAYEPGAPPPPPSPSRLLPRPNTLELGVMGGVLLVSDSNNLVEGGREQRAFELPAWQIGARVAYFPLAALGVEAEYTHGFARTEKVGASPSESADFNALRGHVIGQLPLSRFVPFALVGAGILHGTSRPTGADADLLLQAGLGAKLIATKLLVPRVDFRLGMTQKDGGKLTDGVAFHPEVLLGLALRLGG